jgi:hypothetical protein
MDQLLLPYLYASDELDWQQHLDGLLLVHAAPVVRQALPRRLGGINPHNQDAEDLYQEIMTKIVKISEPYSSELNGLYRFSGVQSWSACLTD